jgi:hypothetical protein
MFRERRFGDLEGKPFQRSSLARCATPPKGESKIAVDERAASAWNWAVKQIESYDQQRKSPSGRRVARLLPQCALQTYAWSLQ